MQNLLLATDSYKHTHADQYPDGTTKIYSYLESRLDNSWTVFFGLQPLLTEIKHNVVDTFQIKQASKMLAEHFGNPSLFNEAGWDYIANELKGRLPISIKAVPEGTVVPTKNVLMTIENTDPKCHWLTNFIETYLMQVWYPCTVASISRGVRNTIKDALERTGSPDQLPFKLHDFGCRGASSMETAAIGGSAHLVNFKGTDNLPALRQALWYYNEMCAGYSVPASEHSTMTTWGREHEIDAYRNMLRLYPEGIVSIVIDSWDAYNAVRNIIGKELKEEILGRNGVTVIRPDSGDPKTIVLDLLKILGESFGFTTNEKGYKVLNPKVRLLQGDGLTPEVIQTILHRIAEWGWSADNVVFGMGGGLLQKCDRDTYKFAIKASDSVQKGEEVSVYKNPATDPGKNSKRGRLKLIKVDGNFVTVPTHHDGKNELVEVFRDGELLVSYDFEQVRKNMEACPDDPVTGKLPWQDKTPLW